MSGRGAAAGRPLEGLRDLRLVLHEVRYEQLAFWSNRMGALFTVGSSIGYLFLLGVFAGSSRVDFLGNIRLVEYFVPALLAYAVMATCFTNMAIQLVIRRETGLLKRLRLSPLPAWALVSAIFVSTLFVVLLQIVLLLAIGRVVFDVPFLSDIETLAVALTLGTISFTALGVAMSTLIRRQEAAGPVTATLFFILLFLSGLFFPIPANTLLSQVASWVPVRAFIEVVEFASTNTQPGMSPEAWHDLLVLVAWGVAGGVVTVWRFRWVPSRS